jgi:hypothetical protein
MARQRRSTRSRAPCRPTCRLGCELLEARHLLAGDLGLGVEPIVWQGVETVARAAYWNGRFESATPYGRVALPPALLPLPTWTTTSLGEGFFSLFAPDASPQLVLDWAAQTPGVLQIEPDLVVEVPFGTAAAAAPGSMPVDPEAVPNDPG